jgi:uncharacterized membrane protein YphA (DoxX/SURF4 family)
VFLSEGIQKFLDPTTLGSGRSSRIGIPCPEVMGPLVGGVEVVCGSLVLAGLLTRLAAIPLVATMAVAIVSTKLPILLGRRRHPSAASAGAPDLTPGGPSGR